MNDEVLLSDFKRFGITNLQILPHYSRFIGRFENFEERAKQFEVDNNCNVIRIDDGQGIFISENLIEITSFFFAHKKELTDFSKNQLALYSYNSHKGRKHGENPLFTGFS